MSRRQEIHDKIYSRIECVPSERMGSDCHVWTGPTSGSKGRGKDYPRMYLDGQTVAVHKVNWTNEHGFIPGKMTLDHLCRNRKCIRDTHLEMVTNRENNIRRAKAAKETKDE